MATEFKGQITLDLENVKDIEKELNVLASKIKEMGVIDIDFDVNTLEGLKQKLIESENALEAIESTGKKLPINFQKTTAAVRQLKNGIQAAEKATLRTALASTNMIRVIQDAPFGMLGMANNIQELSQSISIMTAKTGSMGLAIKTAFMPLITGPMMLPFLITIVTTLALSWDKLGSAINWVAGTFKGLTSEMITFAEEAKKLAKGSIIEDLAEKLQSVTDPLLLGAGITSFAKDISEALEEKRRILREEIGRKEVQMATPSGFATTTVIEETVEGGLERLEQANEKLDKLEASRITIITRLAEIIGERNLEEDLIKRGVIVPKSEREKGRLLTIAGTSIADVERVGDIMLMRIEEQEEKISLALRIRRDRGEVLTDKEMAEMYIGMPILTEAQLIEQINLPFNLAREAFNRASKRARGIIAASTLQARGAGALAFAGAMTGELKDPTERREQMLRARTEAMDAELQVRLDANARALQVDGLHLNDLKRLEVERLVLLAQKNANTRRFADLEIQLEEQKTRKLIAAAQSFVGGLGSALGQANEEKKGILKAGAMMDAIAASIAIYSSVIRDPFLPWYVKIPLAAAQSAAVFASMLSQIRKIDEVGKDANISLGRGLIASNSVTGVRSAQNRSQTAIISSSGAVQTGQLAAGIQANNDLIGDIKIVYDDKIAGDIFIRGGRRVQRTSRTT